MWNAHELPSSAVPDRFLRQFVCTDYFHDSFINQVLLTDSGRSLAMLLGCEREGARYATRALPQFLHRLEFVDCTHLEIGAAGLPYIYLNGRFKIHEWPVPAGRAKRPRRSYYLRLQVLDDGPGAAHIDIRFRSFRMSREVGSHDMRAARALVGTPSELASGWSGRPRQELRRFAAQGTTVERCLALEALAVLGDRRSSPLAEAGLRSRHHGLLAASVHALGLLGSRAHVPLLASVLRRVTDRFARRQIIEAMGRASRR